MTSLLKVIKFGVGKINSRLFCGIVLISTLTGSMFLNGDYAIPFIIGILSLFILICYTLFLISDLIDSFRE